jgi:hypothetical protein
MGWLQNCCYESRNETLREIKSVRLASILCLIVGAVVSDPSAAQSVTAKKCGVDQKQPAQRIFADPDGKHGWREYRTVEEVPELELNAGDFAKVWSGRDGSVLISTEEPGEDFYVYTDYCFDPQGQLVQARYELRTAWGWGYREEGPMSKGLLAARTTEFFDTKTNARIPRPEEAANIPDALQPRLYLRESRLPFFKLLSKK